MIANCVSSPKDEKLTYGSGPVRETLRAHYEPLLACYEERLKTRKRDDRLDGTLVVGIMIEPSGMVERIRVVDPFERSVDACIVAEIEKIEFPPHPDKGIVEIIYPLRFDSIRGDIYFQ